MVCLCPIFVGFWLAPNFISAVVPAFPVIFESVTLKITQFHFLINIRIRMMQYVGPMSQERSDTDHRHAVGPYEKCAGRRVAGTRS